MTDANEYLQRLVKDLENKDYTSDPKHLVLIMDLMALLQEALDFKFHDFHQNSADAPKMYLHQRLLELDKKMQDGEYDNLIMKIIFETPFGDCIRYMSGQLPLEYRIAVPKQVSATLSSDHDSMKAPETLIFIFELQRDGGYKYRTWELH